MPTLQSKKPLQKTLHKDRRYNMDDYNYDYCYECGGYGDDYHLDENGEWVSSCPGCPYNTLEDYEGQLPIT